MPSLFPHTQLHDFVVRVLVHFDVPENDALEAADILIAADLRGIDSHGVARLKPYVDRLESGRINPRPSIRIVRETPGTATVDGDNGLGLVVGPFANALAIEKAKTVGTGWVSVRNSNHFGIAGYYPLQAIEHDLIGIAMTNASRIVAPLWSAEGMLGTNPIAIAFPGFHEPPIVIDMATSTVAFGKIEIAHRQDQPVPEGWAIDKNGGPAQAPEMMIEGGALLPLGSSRQMGGHKGYCLATMVDILSCVLSGASWGPFAPSFAPMATPRAGNVGKGIGHFFGAWQIDGFIDPEEFKQQIDQWIATFRASKPVAGTDGPLIPGDPEREAEKQRIKQGIPLLPVVAENLRDISRRTGVVFDG